MSQTTLNVSEMTAENDTTSKGLRSPNRLRAGVTTFVATIAVAGGVLAVVHVALNRGVDAYYGQKIAALKTAPADPAYAKALDVSNNADAEQTAPNGATVSAN